MSKIKTGISVVILVAAFIILTAAAVLVPFGAWAEEGASKYNVSSLFGCRPGESSGQEKTVAATADNGLPAYFYDEVDSGFKESFECKGALVGLSKTVVGVKSTVRSAEFSIMDNTKNEILISLLPAGNYNNYYDKIYNPLSGQASISVVEAYKDTKYWPPLRDLRVRLVDAADPNNFITVDFAWQTGANSSYNISRLKVFAPGQQSMAERGDGALNSFGALVPQSYWGNTYNPFTLYYDAAENALYADTCDLYGENITKTLVRDFDKVYAEDDVTWEGFKGDTVFAEFLFTGGNQDSKVLVFNLDGLALETDSEGYLLSAAADAYNAVEGNKYLFAEDVSWSNGLTEYALPALKSRNMLTSFDGGDAITELYTVTVYDSSGTDITASALVGLSDGKWTKDARFVPTILGDFKFSYSLNGKNIDFYADVRVSREVSELLSVDKQGAAQFEYDKKAPDYMSGEVANITGLGISFTDTFTLSYNHVIDLRTLDADVPLIKYIIAPKTQAVYDSTKSSDSDDEFNSIIIRLTDAEDENKYIEVLHNRSRFGTHLSFVTAAASGQEYANNKQNKDFGSYLNNNGMAMNFTFTGCSSIFSSFYYDYDGNRVLAGPDHYDNTILEIRDFDNPKQLLGGENAFDGFLSGKAKLSVMFSGVKADSANIILYEICGQRFSGSSVIDSTPPEIIDENNFLEEKPLGEVGTLFPFPSFSAFDMIFGDVTSNLTFDVYHDYGSENEQKIVSSAAGFVPDKKGIYTIVAKVVDGALNEKKMEFNVEVIDKIPFMTLKLSDEYPSSIYVGDSIKLPDYRINGGSGNKNIVFTVTDPDGMSLDLSRNNILFSKQGVYTASYLVTDYLGVIKVFRYYISTTYSPTPIMDDVTVPVALLSGKKFVFARPVAYDYTSFIGEKRHADVEVYITEPGKERFKLGENLEYTPSVDSGTVKVEYVAAAVLDKSKFVAKTYEIKIISPKKMGDYFVTEGNIRTDYVAFDADSLPEAAFIANGSGSSITFINPLPGDNFTVTLKGTIGSALSKIRMILVDSVNPWQRIELSFTVNGNNSVIEQNGISADMAGSFAPGQTLRVNLKNGNCIYDKDGMIAARLDKNVYGDDFSGFTSGKMYISIVYDAYSNGSSGGLSIQNLVNQPRFYDNMDDEIAPFILIENKYKLYNDYGSVITLSKAHVTDVLDSEAEIYLTVRAPDGSIIYDAVSCDQEYEMRLTQYGTYIVTYRAFDSSYNLTSRNFNIVSYDNIEPVIEISGTVKTEYKVGEKLVLNEVRATDNVTLSEDMSVTIIIIDDYSGYIATVKDGFKFTHAGSYTLRFFVEDGFKNYCLRDFKITVTD